MSAVVLRAEGLGKRYRLGQRERYVALRDRLSRVFSAPARLLRREQHVEQESPELWALRDVSFEVRQGEVVGIIGRNGAGKSTLLKILSRITAPTTGRVQLRGRVGSLLEVGTGFHPELTGRENILLNGAILGMRRAEILRKFEAIVAFAEVERFIDTPVKHYSSGMYMRLAFAVAAHLEPEILVVDEVLAVGDAEFQRKCFAKMREVGNEGRTILFVSHNMAAVRQICRRGILMERGHVRDQGPIDQIADRYLSGVVAQQPSERIQTPSFVVEAVELKGAAGSAIKTFGPLTITVQVQARVAVQDPGLYVGLLSLEQQRLAGLDFKDFQSTGSLVAGQRISFVFQIESLPLLPGLYQLELHVKDMFTHTIECVDQQFAFEVLETPVYGGRTLDGWFGTVGLKASVAAFADESSVERTASGSR